jgi:hypothetical protein
MIKSYQATCRKFHHGDQLKGGTYVLQMMTQVVEVTGYDDAWRDG